jgi:hypothetical protein
MYETPLGLVVQLPPAAFSNERCQTPGNLNRPVHFAPLDTPTAAAILPRSVNGVFPEEGSMAANSRAMNSIRTDL